MRKKNNGSFLKFGFGVFTGFGLVLLLSPTAREVCKEKISEAVEFTTPYIQEYRSRLMDAVEKGREAAIKKEEELEEQLQSAEQKSLEQEESPDYIV